MTGYKKAPGHFPAALRPDRGAPDEMVRKNRGD